MLGKDPNRRKSRPGSRVRAKRGGSRSKAERPPSSARVSSRTGASADTHTNTHPNAKAARLEETFVLYVEGARDRGILECWARRIDPRLARCIERNTVILGGRRPARAIEDFENRGGTAAGYSGLIVLDGDDLPQSQSADANASTTASNSIGKERGLEVFVWSLRHIESYLLVPAAIRRMLRLSAEDRRVERFIEAHSLEHAARGDVHSCPDRRLAGSTTKTSGSLHAKRVLGAGGSLSKALGSELRAGEIARAMRLEDLHQDVLALFKRMSVLSGVGHDGPEVVLRNLGALGPGGANQR